MSNRTTTNHTLTESQSSRWLALQGACLGSATRGCLYILPSTTTYYWPEKHDNPGHFHQVCTRAEKEKKGVILSFQDKGKEKKETNNCIHIALPIFLNDNQILVSAFELQPKDQSQLHQAMQRLEWGLNWLKEDLLTCDTEQGANSSQLDVLLQLQNKVQNQSSFTDALQLLADDMATLLSCQRVSLGLYKKNQITVMAISSQSQIDTTSPLIRDITHAMEECYDQQTSILYPAPPQPVGPITRQHQTLTRTHGGTTAFSQPVTAGGEMADIILTIEKTSSPPLQPAKLQFCDNAAKIIGPILAIKISSERSLATIISYKTGQLYKNVTEKKRYTLLKAGAIILFAMFCFFFKGDFRIQADVTLSGTIVRGIVAPFPGYVATANKSAGDHVQQGEVLASLDTSDLTLEELTWRSKYTQADLEYRKAIANNSTSHAKIIAQQKKQAEIQLSLLGLQKERAEIKAPFSGIIVEGDLSQSVGGPVEKGKLLFEMIPESGFKVLAQVDEKDISFIEKGQAGTLIFNSLPKEKHHFSLSKITPVSTAKDGSNSFRVEASLQEISEKLRPGMKGYGKITVGRKPLIWLWTRTLRAKIRHLVWTLLP
ncbi:MAG: multidrug resistance efflux pump [Desulforhopalus sp.]|jgi:multidrug resistance efflux pump